MPLRILIADDHPLYREGLRTSLEAVDDFEVVGEAATGREVVAQALELQPDVVVMDLHMPDLNGIEATRQITDRAPATRVLVLTMLEGDDSLFASMRAGACGYILKGAKKEETVRAIRAVAGGEVIFGSGVAKRMSQHFAASAGNSPHPFPELTSREREVLDLLAQGQTNASIALRLALSPKTVRNHVSNVFNKLEVSGRAEAIAKAREAGLGGRST